MSGTDHDVTNLKSSHDVDSGRIAAALREAADGCSEGALRRFDTEQRLWDATEADTPADLLRSLADDVQSGRATVRGLNYAEYIAVDQPVEERIEIFVAYGDRPDEHYCSVTYVPVVTPTEIEVYDDHRYEDYGDGASDRYDGD